MVQEVTSYGELYPGRFIAADGKLFANGNKPTLTIERVVLDELEGERGVEQKVVVALRETPQAWVLPKICGTCLRAMWGADVRQWIGKRVTLYATADIMPFPAGRGRKPDPCIRVWGSPDIDADVAVTFSPPKRKAIVMTMRAVRGEAGGQKAGDTRTAALDELAERIGADEVKRLMAAAAAGDVAAFAPEHEAAVSRLGERMKGDASAWRGLSDAGFEALVKIIGADPMGGE